MSAFSNLLSKIGLSVRDAEHALAAFLGAGVPVALATSASGLKAALVGAISAAAVTALRKVVPSKDAKAVAAVATDVSKSAAAPAAVKIVATDVSTAADTVAK